MREIDEKRLEMRLWVPNIKSDSAFGSLVRWLAFIFNMSISLIEEEIGLCDSHLSKAMTLRKAPMRGAVPQLFCAWLYRATGYHPEPDVVRDLSTVSGEEWMVYARIIRRALRAKVKP